MLGPSMGKANILIDPALHAEHSAHRDSCGIRFVYFVEDALAQAIAFEKIPDPSE